MFRGTGSVCYSMEMHDELVFKLSEPIATCAPDGPLVELVL